MFLVGNQPHNQTQSLRLGHTHTPHPSAVEVDLGISCCQGRKGRGVPSRPDQCGGLGERAGGAAALVNSSNVSFFWEAMLVEQRKSNGNLSAFLPFCLWNQKMLNDKGINVQGALDSHKLSRMHANTRSVRGNSCLHCQQD